MAGTIIALSGKAGVGKDEAAGILYREYDFERIALADPIKEFASKIFGFTQDQLWGSSEFRDQVSPRWNLTARRVLQVLGTDIVRNLHPEVWLQYAWEKITALTSRGKDVVVTDVRFPNEVEFFLERRAKVVRIVRQGIGVTDTEAHASEMAQDDVPDSEFDAVIANDGTLEAYRSKVRSMLEIVSRPSGATLALRKLLDLAPREELHRHSHLTREPFAFLMQEGVALVEKRRRVLRFIVSDEPAGVAAELRSFASKPLAVVDAGDLVGHLGAIDGVQIYVSQALEPGEVRIVSTAI